MTETKASLSDSSESSTGSSDEEDFERYPQLAIGKRSHGDLQSEETGRAFSMGDESGSAKKRKDDASSSYSSVAQRMMARMGHEEGQGLGSTVKGIAEPILPEMRMGKRGLGFTIPGFDPTSEDFEEAEEGKFLEPTIHETANWLAPCTEPIPSAEELKSWMSEGPVKMEIDDETHFCSGEILQNILKCKTAFDKLESHEFLKARTRSNPYELIKNGIFLNRAAMKMANMDKIFNFMFSYPKLADGTELVRKNDLLYFADICSAPGGFSEYVLWRRRQDMAKGFGFTLKSGPGVNDFKLDDFFSAPVEFFEPHYGVGGVDGDGDIMRSENITAFQEFVIRSTNNEGVHFVMGDGGFSVAGQENIQEILSKQLVLCQFCMAMSVLREGGNFVCKIFDIFTPFTAGLFYLLWRAFDRVAICKPITSRPANSERYVVCQGFRNGAGVIQQYLYAVNMHMNTLKLSRKARSDVVEVVPLSVLEDCSVFSDYLTESNESLGTAQVNSLRRLAHYVRNTNLCVQNQAKIRRDCLAEWKVPDQVRAAPPRCNPSEKINQLDAEKDVQSFIDMCRSPSELSGADDFSSSVTNLSDYHCSVCCGQRMLLLSLGRSNIYVLHKDSRGWARDPNLSKLVLPANTLLDVDLVEEMRGEGKGQRRTPTVYINDAIVVNGKNVRHRHYEDRLRVARKVALAVRSLSRPDLTTLRVNQAVGVKGLPDLLSRLSMKRVKGRSQERLAYQLESTSEVFVCPVGLSFTRHIMAPWSSSFSKTHNRHYYFNPVLKKSTFDCPPDAIAQYGPYVESQRIWPWSRDNPQLHFELTRSQPSEPTHRLSKSSLLAHVSRLVEKEH